MTESGEVKFITGVVISTDENGSRRILQIGDEVSVAELIETSESGSVSIEFENGALLDLGRNASSSYEIESENPLLIKGEEVVSAVEQLLGDETYDPTEPDAGLEAPGAGPATGGQFEDDGSFIVQTEYAEPRRTPDNGFETEGISAQFPQQTPLELIQNSIADTGTSPTIVEIPPEEPPPEEPPPEEPPPEEPPPEEPPPEEPPPEEPPPEEPPPEEPPPEDHRHHRKSHHQRSRHRKSHHQRNLHYFLQFQKLRYSDLRMKAKYPQELRQDKNKGSLSGVTLRTEIRSRK